MRALRVNSKILQSFFSSVVEQLSENHSKITFRTLYESFFSCIDLDLIRFFKKTNLNANLKIRKSKKNDLDYNKVIKIHMEDIYITRYVTIFVCLFTGKISWWPVSYTFCDACCSWTSSTDEFFIEWNASAICSWTSCHVTAFLCVPLLYFGYCEV